MNLRADEISSLIQKQIEGFEEGIELKETGRVISVGDGIARIYGLGSAMAGELLEFPGGLSGMVLNLEEDNVGAVLLGRDDNIKEGDEVKRTGRIMEVPIGPEMVGRVVDGLGQPIDGKGSIKTDKFGLFPNHVVLKFVPFTLYSFQVLFARCIHLRKCALSRNVFLHVRCVRKVLSV